MRLTMNSGMGKMAGRGGENEAASVWNFVLNYYYFLKKKKIIKKLIFKNKYFKLYNKERTKKEKTKKFIAFYKNLSEFK